jgi:hypothetical protein
MPRQPSDRNPPQRHLRRLAWVIALVVAVVAWRWPDPLQGFGLRFSAALIFAIGTVWPRLFRWLYRLVALATYPLRWAFGQRAFTFL